MCTYGAHDILICAYIVWCLNTKNRSIHIYIKHSLFLNLNIKCFVGFWLFLFVKKKKENNTSVAHLWFLLKVLVWVPTLTSLSNRLLPENVSQIKPLPLAAIGSVLSQQQKSQVLRIFLFLYVSFQTWFPVTLWIALESAEIFLLSSPVLLICVFLLGCLAKSLSTLSVSWWFSQTFATCLCHPHFLLLFLSSAILSQTVDNYA